MILLNANASLDVGHAAPSKLCNMRNLILIVALCLVAAGCKPKSTASANKPVTEEALQELQGYIQRDVAGGFRPENEIAASAVEILSEEYDSKALAQHATTMTREALAQHKREQDSWPKTTDCDRLDAAFAELERAGVVCRQDFSCCGTCGSAEIYDEIEKATKTGKQVGGYAFYHMQDTESAVEGRGLYLNYGAVQEDEAAALKIAQQVVAALKQNGLKADWDGTWAKRIGVSMDWKRRR